MSVEGRRQLLPGDYYLTRIAGWTGVFIKFAQWCIGDFSRYAHAGIYLGNGLVAEAMPGGLQINPITKYEGKEFIYSYNINLTNGERERIVQMAYGMEGHPYAYLAYPYIGLTYFKHCPEWVKRYVESNQSLICSQFVEYCFDKAAGRRLFNDKVYLDATPGDLSKLVPHDITVPTYFSFAMLAVPDAA